MSADWKSYIGDGVYAQLDQFGALILTTEDGVRVTNRIVLEPEVYSELQRFLLKIAEIQVAARNL